MNSSFQIIKLLVRVSIEMSKFIFSLLYFHHVALFFFAPILLEPYKNFSLQLLSSIGSYNYEARRQILYICGGQKSKSVSMFQRSWRKIMNGAFLRRIGLNWRLTAAPRRAAPLRIDESTRRLSAGRRTQVYRKKSIQGQLRHFKLQFFRHRQIYVKKYRIIFEIHNAKKWIEDWFVEKSTVGVVSVRSINNIFGKLKFVNAAMIVYEEEPAKRRL